MAGFTGDVALVIPSQPLYGGRIRLHNSPMHPVRFLPRRDEPALDPGVEQGARHS